MKPRIYHLSEVSKTLEGTGIAVGAQNCAAEANPPFPKTFDFIESLFAVFSSADDLGMVRLSKGMPASRVRGNNEERESHHP